MRVLKELISKNESNFLCNQNSDSELAIAVHPSFKTIVYSGPHQQNYFKNVIS